MERQIKKRKRATVIKPFPKFRNVRTKIAEGDERPAPGDGLLRDISKKEEAIIRASLARDDFVYNVRWCDLSVRERAPYDYTAFYKDMLKAWRRLAEKAALLQTILDASLETRSPDFKEPSFLQTIILIRASTLQNLREIWEAWKAVCNHPEDTESPTAPSKKEVEFPTGPSASSLQSTTPSTVKASELAKPAPPQHIFQILYMLASPPLLVPDAKDPSSWFSLEKLRIRDELEMIESAVRGVVPLVIKPATPASLAMALTRAGAWLHLSMHATKDLGGALVLEHYNTAQAVLLWRVHLRQILKACTRIAGVFISSCGCQWVADLFEDAGVKHIVYFDHQVLDAEASQVAEHFYSTLANSCSVREAVDFANEKSGSQNLRVSDGNLHLAPHVPTSLSAHVSSESIPTGVIPTDFHRRRETYLVTRVLQHSDVVLLLSDVPSCGLTTTLGAIAEYVSSYGRWLDHRCTFFRPGHEIPPASAKGVLFIVDDADGTMRREQWHTLCEYLDEGAKLLYGSHVDFTEDASIKYFGASTSVGRVHLPPLTSKELANIFLGHCGRVILAQELMPSQELAGTDPNRPLPREEALTLVAQHMAGFDGRPGDVRRAAERCKRGLSCGDALRTPCIGEDVSQEEDGLNMCQVLRRWSHLSSPILLARVLYDPCALQKDIVEMWRQLIRPVTSVIPAVLLEY